MVWYLTPDHSTRALIHRTGSRTNHKKAADPDHDNCSENPSHDFPIGKIQTIDNNLSTLRLSTTFDRIMFLSLQ
jgi:hypothetical protein